MRDPLFVPVHNLAVAVYGERDVPTVDPAPSFPGIPCTYCEEPLGPSAFSFTSPTQRLLSATCPACAHDVRLTAARWQRLGGRLAVVRSN
jgi:hypothetical protein